MIYLVCYDWRNTSNNHAGMRYLCKYLEETYPHEFKSLVMPREKKHKLLRNNLFFRVCYKIRSIIDKRNCNSELQKFVLNFLPILKNNDIVFLMEYMSKSINQYLIAKEIKKIYPSIKIYGLSHLVPSKIDKDFSDCDLIKWTSCIDKLVTFGHSLSDYYVSRHIPKENVFTSFHYVDDYYLNNNIVKHENVTVIVTGSQMRNTKLLLQIVLSNPDIHFYICQGLDNLSSVFTTPNVTLIPFVEESELRNYMYNSDISLNVMYDTIGSNVIVTSMGMGLGMICSDVGSIRDYCDENNTIFCNSLDDFNNALNLLTSDSAKLESFRKSAYMKAKGSFSIENFYRDIMKITE